MTKKNTKRSLILSVLSLLVCCSMLIGSTFAWFTDEVASGKNKIVAGNLDVELAYYNGSAWESVNNATDLFTGNLWEPGHTEVVYLKLSNLGSLALKYQLGVNIVSETSGTNVDGKTFKLSDYIYMGVVENVNGETGAYADREAAVSAVSRASIISTGYTKSGSMLKDADDLYLAVVVYMPESVGNEANYKTGTVAPEIDLGINLVATQLTAENDSFGNDYDADALVCDVLATPATFAEILANAQEGTVIGMAAGEYIGTITIPQNNITLVSNAAIVDSVDLNGKDGVTLDGLTFYAIYDQIQTSNYKSGAYKPSGYYASITNTTSTPYGADDVVIKNCTFKTFDYTIGWGNYDPATYCAIDFEDAGRVSGPSANVTIENCTFETPAVNHIRLNYVDGDVVVKNNKFVAPTSHHNINASGNKANWTVTGNAFSNWADGEYAFGTSRDSGTEVLTLKIVNNTFNKSLAKNAEIPVLSIKSSYTAANSVVVVENNVANNGNATIDAAIRNDYKYYMTGDSGFATVSSKADIKNALSNGFDVVDAGGANIGKLEYGLNTSLVPAGKTVTISNAVIDGWNYGNAVAGTVVFENCTFTSDSAYSIHFDAGNGDVVFNNCVLEGWCSFGSAIKSVTFNDCTIRGNGIYSIVRCYQDFTMENCVIDASNTITTDVYQDGIDVVSGCTATMINCTNVNGSVKDLFEAEDIAGTDGAVIIK